MTEIKTVFFDFGGVFTLSPFDALEAMGHQMGAAPGQLKSIVFGDYEQDGDHPWHRLERGEITLEAARLSILESAKVDHELNIDVYELFAALPRDGGLRPELVHRVERIREMGLQTAIITNNVKEFSSGWRSLLPVDDLFDAVFDSCEMGIRKPNPAIYEKALEAMSVSAQQALFLDDYEANVRSAEALGMDSIWVREPLNECWQVLDQKLLL